MKQEKVYRVEFMEYTNCMKDCVCKGEYLSTQVYLKVGKEPFLVKETDLDLYKEYGKGYRKIEFVGYLEKKED